jgi:hypothetical protein
MREGVRPSPGAARHAFRGAGCPGAGGLAEIMKEVADRDLAI